MNHPDERAKHLDEWLGSALERYSHAEPQPALESRIIANLRAQRERAARLWAWGTALAVAAVLLLVTVAVTLVDRKDYGPAVVKTRNQEAASPSSGATNGASREAHGIAAGPHAPSREGLVAARTARRDMETMKILNTASSEVEGPRLAQFPSSRPDSEQARLLAAYLENVPAGEMVAIAGETNSIRDLVVSDLSVTPLSWQAENSMEEK
jgi:hypothetical protein